MKVIFAGGKKQGAEALEQLVKMCEVVAVDGDNDVKSTARYLGIPIVDQEEMCDYINGHSFSRIHYGFDIENVDLLVSYLRKHKVREPLLSYPKLGCVNFHPGLLPYFGSGCGYNVAILENSAIYGCTAHFMTDQIDKGDLIETRVIQVNEDETAHSLAMRTYTEMFHLFKSVCKKIQDGKVTRTPQTNTRCMKWAEVDKLRAILPDDDTETIDRKIRAFWFPPYNGAEIELKGRKYTLAYREL